MIGAIVSFLLRLLGNFLSRPKPAAPPPALQIEEKTDAKVEQAAAAEQRVAAEQLRPSAPPVEDSDPFCRD